MSVYPETVEVRRSAKISADGLYRYALTRRWAWGPGAWPAMFVMLNPSTADAEQDDPTIRRCIGFARAFGAAGIVVTNLYAFRAAKPADLWKVADPVGPENDRILAFQVERAANSGRPVIAAWGANAKPERVAQVCAMRHADTCLTALGVTKAGAPRHPLYLPADAHLTPWSAR